MKQPTVSRAIPVVLDDPEDLEEDVDFVAMFLDYVKDKQNHDQHMENSLIEAMTRVKLEQVELSEKVANMAEEVKQCKKCMKEWARQQIQLEGLLDHENCVNTQNLRRKIQSEKEEYGRLQIEYAQTYENREKTIMVVKRQQKMMQSLENEIAKEKKERQNLKNHINVCRDGFSSLLNSKSKEIDGMLFKQAVETTALTEQRDKMEAALLKCEEEFNNKNNEATTLKDILDGIDSTSLTEASTSN